MLKFRAASIAALLSAALVCQIPMFAQQGAPAAAPGAGAGRGAGGRGGPGRGDGASTAPAPKNADGKPDISGAWAPNAIRQNVDMVGSGVKVPLKPGPEKIYLERKENISKDDPEARCLPPGVPRMSTTPYPFRIMQTKDLTLIVYEGGAHIWRQIFTDGRKHDPNHNPDWLGDSIGWWEGDTFVVDTTGFNGKTWIDESGLPTSEQLHVIERFHRDDMGHMTIEHTVEDPENYTEPWKFTTHPLQLKGEMIEYICQENNRDLEHLKGK